MSSLKFRLVKENMGSPTKKDRNTIEQRAPKSLQQTFSLKAGPSHYVQSFKTWKNGGDSLPKGKCRIYFVLSVINVLKPLKRNVGFEVIGMSKADLKQVPGV